MHLQNEFISKYHDLTAIQLILMAFLLAGIMIIYIAMENMLGKVISCKNLQKKFC